MLTDTIPQPRDLKHKPLIEAIALGSVNDKPAVIFEILVRTTTTEPPQSPNEIHAWLGGAHDIIDKWFFAIIRGDLEKQFEGDNGD